jgi:uncharacterized protein YdhG (YjbR/CyaY superfamily)
MTATDVDVGEEAIRRLAGQLFDPPKDRTKANRTVGENKDGNATGKKKHQKKQGQSDDGKEKRPVYAQKYHDGDLLAEAVVVGRKSYFAVATPAMGDPQQVSITLQDSIPVDDNTVLKPFEIAAYVNEPYTFKSEQEFYESVENTRDESLDSLYRKVKSIWRKYVDADDFHISICAADTIFTYFQDRIGLTHYLFFVGDNSSGKSNNLTVLHYIAYRNMMSSGMTAANVYQFLGSGEEGVGTICEDEADNIDEDREKMKVHKNGYTTGKYYHRTDTSVGRQQLKFNTFCFKAFAAEKLPDSVIAKGFNQRTIELPCVYGFPEYDISEVANPAGEEEYQELLDELLEIRNTLLVYRLLHFKDKIPDIKLNIQGREKQLFKPILRVFQHTHTQNELLPVISKYISQRRENNANTLNAFLYDHVKGLIKAQNTYELESNLIWNTIKSTLQGKDIPSKPQSYDTVEFGTVSQKGITETLIQVFGAKPTKRHSGRTLVFDQTKLQRLSRIYDLSIDVKVGPPQGVADVADVAHVGLDKHLQEQNEDKEIAISERENTNISNEGAENNEKIILQEEVKDSRASADVPQAPHVPPVPTKQDNADYMNGPSQRSSEHSNNAVEEYSTKLLLNQGAYWSGSKWNCKSCKYSYDGPGMIQHLRLEHNQQQSREDL